MTSREFKDRLARRARKAQVEFPGGILAPLETYFRLLAQWNAKINLTGLPLQTPTDETFDRLFVEPLVAATLVADRPGVWFDLGSGGGSPAFPLKLIRPKLSLTLVESKIRKAAFLREVVRVLQLAATEVANTRFEELEVADRGVDLVTVRAVRTDTALLKASARLLKPGGQLLLFGQPLDKLKHPDFQRAIQSTAETSSRIVTSYVRVFHVEQLGRI